MTELRVRADAGEAVGRCRWCQRPLVARVGPGRPREYCRQSCRQREYEARQRSVERGLDENEIVITRSRLHDLYDRLWVLSCAIEDVDGDLRRAEDAADYRAAIDWLLEAARPLVVELHL